MLSALPGFTTGGTIHVIVNNQIGFTTAPEDYRFTRYPSDLAQVVQAPVFHVNGDDPEAVVQAARLAVGFRQTFRTRRVHRLRVLPPARPQRAGRSDLHAAGDVPSRSASIPSVAELYAERLAEAGVLERREIEAMPGGRPSQIWTRRWPRRASAAPSRRCSPSAASGRARRGRATTGARTPRCRPSACARSPRRSAGCREGFTPHPRWPSAPRGAPRDGGARRGHRLGLRRACWPTAACCSRASRCASAGRTPCAARSATATPCCSTPKTGAPVRAAQPSGRASRRCSSSSTAR